MVVTEMRISNNQNNTFVRMWFPHELRPSAAFQRSVTTSKMNALPRLMDWLFSVRTFWFSTRRSRLNFKKTLWNPERRTAFQRAGTEYFSPQTTITETVITRSSNINHLGNTRFNSSLKLFQERLRRETIAARPPAWFHYPQNLKSVLALRLTHE